MFDQPQDFVDESEALYNLIKDKTDLELGLGTQFKYWTIEDIISHLHVWNCAADMSLHDELAFMKFMGEVMKDLPTGNLRAFEERWLDGLSGRELVRTWRDFYLGMGERFAKADPKARVMWAGPSMSVRSSITARLMETWAHGQAVYDILNVERVNTDRIKNIVVLGVNTFEWTFKNKELPIPEHMPYVRLTSPSGLIWQYGTPNNDMRIVGSAADFCQVVTQTRSVFDTSLKTRGELAKQWMSIAQCFAGPAETPPLPGERYKQANL